MKNRSVNAEKVKLRDSTQPRGSDMSVAVVSIPLPENEK